MEGQDFTPFSGLEGQYISTLIDLVSLKHTSPESSYNSLLHSGRTAEEVHTLFIESLKVFSLTLSEISCLLGKDETLNMLPKLARQSCST